MTRAEILQHLRDHGGYIRDTGEPALVWHEAGSVPQEQAIPRSQLRELREAGLLREIVRQWPSTSSHYVLADAREK